jgi:hypothetical protein
MESLEGARRRLEGSFVILFVPLVFIGILLASRAQRRHSDYVKQWHLENAEKTRSKAPEYHSPKDIAPITTSIRFDPKRPIGERWLILEHSEHSPAMVVRAALPTPNDAERALATSCHSVKTTGPRKPVDGAAAGMLCESEVMKLLTSHPNSVRGSVSVGSGMARPRHSSRGRSTAGSHLSDAFPHCGIAWRASFAR